LRLVERVERPLGHPDNPLADAALLAKFVDCAARAVVPLTQARAQAAAAMLLGIDEQESAGKALRETLF
jgi:2-methylcitrate dehydratase PrpD